MAEKNSNDFCSLNPHKRRGGKRDDKKKRFRTVFTEQQLAALERAYQENKYVSRTKRFHMSRELDIKERTIIIWFQNKRLREVKKHENIEAEKATTPPVQLNDCGTAAVCNKNNNNNNSIGGGRPEIVYFAPAYRPRSYHPTWPWTLEFPSPRYPVPNWWTQRDNAAAANAMSAVNATWTHRMRFTKPPQIFRPWAVYPQPQWICAPLPSPPPPPPSRHRPWVAEAPSLTAGCIDCRTARTPIDNILQNRQ